MICLIRPPVVEIFRFATTTPNVPIGLAYISANLKKSGYPVKVIDALKEGFSTRRRYVKGILVGLDIQQIVSRVPQDAKLVGISCLFTHEWPFVAKLTEALKATYPDKTIVIGGEHVSSMPEFCALTSKADIFVSGEGEETVVEVAQSVVDKTLALSEIRGITYKDSEGAIRKNSRRARNVALDEIPNPDWESFDPLFYQKHRMVGSVFVPGLTIPILATRGCPYQCTFCSSPNMWTTKWAARDPVKVVDEIERAHKTWGATNFPFQDLTAIIKESWIVAFCEEILRRKLKVTWQLPSGTRSEVINQKVAQLLKKSGMLSMAFAPESGSLRTRTLIKKHVDEKALLKALGHSKDAGLGVSAFVVLGFPHDEVEDFVKNEEFVVKLAQSGAQDLAVGFYLPLPGTQLFRSQYESGTLKINRDYFKHLLTNATLLPHQVHMQKMSRLGLSAWKFRLVFLFYRTKLEMAGGVAKTLLNFAKPLFDPMRKQSKSKLRTIIISMFGLTKRLLVGYSSRRWISLRSETEFFIHTEKMYAMAHELKYASLPRENADSASLYRVNSAVQTKTEHAQSLSIPPELFSSGT